MQKYASDKLIADTTASIPHPYPVDGAECFIKDALHKRADKTAFVYALYVGDRFVGVCSLFAADWEQSNVEIGYWIGVPFWGKGYVTQAVSLLLMKAKELGFQTVVGKCLKRNPASKKVLEKNGFFFTKESIGCGRHEKEAVLEYTRCLE